MNRREWRTSASHIDGRPDVPQNGYLEGRGHRYTVGSIIVRHRQAWRVLEIREKPEDLWPKKFEVAWQKHVTDWAAHEAGRVTAEPGTWAARPKPEPIRAQWMYRPINLVVVPVDEPAAVPVHWVGCLYYAEFQILPEHYAVCRLCHELPPCRHEETEQTIDREMAKASELMAIPRGACLGCGKTITGRMKKTLFPGPNLWRPDWGNDTAAFHARRQEECHNALWRYEQQWKAQGLHRLADPTLPEAGEVA